MLGVVSHINATRGRSLQSEVVPSIPEQIDLPRALDLDNRKSMDVFTVVSYTL